MVDEVGSKPVSGRVDIDGGRLHFVGDDGLHIEIDLGQSPDFDVEFPELFSDLPSSFSGGTHVDGKKVSRGGDGETNGFSDEELEQINEFFDSVVKMSKERDGFHEPIHRCDAPVPPEKPSIPVPDMQREHPCNVGEFGGDGYGGVDDGFGEWFDDVCRFLFKSDSNLPPSDVLLDFGMHPQETLATFFGVTPDMFECPEDYLDDVNDFSEACVVVSDIMVKQEIRNVLERIADLLEDNAARRRF